LDISKKTLIQCDFDGTVTVDDVSFMLLDEYARGQWRTINEAYNAHKITVGQFNEQAFNLVKSTKKAMLAYLDGKVKVRPGFKTFVELCEKKKLRLVIVSNGLDFYIRKVLVDLNLKNVEFHAAETRFHGNRVKVRYVGPDGTTVDDAFKEKWVSQYLSEGYQVVYIGNGTSDFPAASQSHHIFATESLLKHCQIQGVTCMPFTSFLEINRVISTW
jgi:2-hydroxy-3-keto-5-methylthiopentenyl-1-phosphate phosphatase